MGGKVIRLSESADEGAQQAPCEAARNRDHPASALHGHGAADDVLLPQSPGILARICVPFRPDTCGPSGDDTVDNTFLLPRRGEDDHVSSPHLFDTAGDEIKPIPRAEQWTHTVTSAEDYIPVFLFRPGHSHSPLIMARHAVHRFDDGHIPLLTNRPYPFFFDLGSNEHQKFSICFFVLVPQIILSIVHAFMHEVLDTDVTVPGQFRRQARIAEDFFKHAKAIPSLLQNTNPVSQIMLMESP
jgi:hypothetical protein